MPNETNPPSKDSGAAALQYVNDQLQKSRQSLKRTRTIGLIVILIVVAYTSYVTHGLLQYFEPASAAEMAKGIIAERVTQHAEDLSRQLRDGVPVWLEKLPDYALEQLPVARTEIETRIETALSDNAKLTASQVERYVDAFLENNKDNIKSILEDADNIETVRHLGPELEKQMRNYLTAHEAGQESLQSTFDHALADLDGVAARVERLATATDLSPEEKRARRAIAVLLKKTDWESTHQEPKQAAK